MYRFALPDIGEGVVEAEILAWRVAEGDRVAEDQVLVEILTDKAEIEVPSPRAGRVHRIHFQAGQTAHVGDVLIEIDDSETARPAAAEAAAAEAPAAAEPAAPPAAEARPAPAPHAPPALPERPRSHAAPRLPEARTGGAVEAVPAVRELARRLGVDLQRVRGSGPRGRIMRRDVEANAAGSAPPAAPPSPATPAAPDPDDWKRLPLRGLRRTIAERLVHSRHTAAHFTYVDEVDVTQLLEALEGPDGGDLSPLAFVARAAVRALAGFPVLNASIDDARGEIVLKGRVHLGVATATEQGLVVPVIRDAPALSARELAARIAELAEGARGGRLGPEQLRGSTFTITSLGRLGGIVSTPILNPPEVAILGVNAIRALPRAVADAIAIRQVLNLSISVDHRIADGIVAARYVQEIRRILEAVDFEELAAGGAPR